MINAGIFFFNNKLATIFLLFFSPGHASIFNYCDHSSNDKRKKKKKEIEAKKKKFMDERWYR